MENEKYPQDLLKMNDGNSLPQFITVSDYLFNISSPHILFIKKMNIRIIVLQIHNIISHYIRHQMQGYRDLYGGKKGKTDSLYIYILYECSRDQIMEHIKKQIEYVNRITDTYKCKLFASRYLMFRDLIESMALKDEDLINMVILIDDQINTHDLTKENIQILEKYAHQSISYVYDDHFDLDYLEDLLFNDKPYNVYKVINNKVDFIQMTRTKKRTMESKESKALDLMEFIDQTLPQNGRYLLTGISGKLKGIQDPRSYCVINKELKMQDLMNMIDQIDQEDNLIAFDQDIGLLHDPKQMHKIVFKKDLNEKIINGQLAKLYIEEKMHNKFMENAKKNSIDVNFKIIIIDTRLKSFNEDREKKIEQYGGVCGVGYY